LSNFDKYYWFDANIRGRFVRHSGNSVKASGAVSYF